MSELITGTHGLLSIDCECGRKKKTRQSFCSKCYFSLPRQLQAALYQRVGEGYEEAHAQARTILKGNK